MIIELLLDAVYLLVSVLTGPINIPSAPEGVQAVVVTALDSIKVGLSLLANWTDLSYLLTLFGVVLLVDGGMAIYHLVMWFLKKIPMLGIE